MAEKTQSTFRRMIKRIAITGPECTGKSQIAHQLAKHFETLFVPEYAREYLNSLGRRYTYNDLLTIAQKQFRNENQLADKAKKFLFCDTDFTILKIWSEDKFGKCDPWILKKFNTHTYDLYLLMDIDLPWIYDPQREDPDRRQFLFDWYKMELESLGADFEIISGVSEARFGNAIAIVEERFNHNF